MKTTQILLCCLIFFAALLTNSVNAEDSIWQSSNVEVQSTSLKSIDTQLEPESSSLTYPGIPTIEWIANEIELVNQQAKIHLSWNLWWGENANQWRILQNGQSIFSSPLSLTQSSQSGHHRFVINLPGVYEFVVQLCNQVGATEVCSNSVPSRVTIWSADALVETKTNNTDRVAVMNLTSQSIM